MEVLVNLLVTNMKALINTTKPTAPETLALVNSLEEKYQVSVIALDVLNMTENDMDHLLKVAMDEFDISELNLEVPTWVNKYHIK